MIFSGPLQPALIGAAIASARVHLSTELSERQDELRERIELFNTLAEARGIPLGSPAATPIRFVETGDNRTTYQMAGDLMSEGFYTNTAVFPAVSKQPRWSPRRADPAPDRRTTSAASSTRSPDGSRS